MLEQSRVIVAGNGKGQEIDAGMLFMGWPRKTAHLPGRKQGWEDIGARPNRKDYMFLRPNSLLVPLSEGKFALVDPFPGISLRKIGVAKRQIEMIVLTRVDYETIKSLVNFATHKDPNRHYEKAQIFVHERAIEEATVPLPQRKEQYIGYSVDGMQLDDLFDNLAGFFVNVLPKNTLPRNTEQVEEYSRELGYMVDLLKAIYGHQRKHLNLEQHGVESGMEFLKDLAVNVLHRNTGLVNLGSGLELLVDDNAANVMVRVSRSERILFPGRDVMPTYLHSMVTKMLTGMGLSPWHTDEAKRKVYEIAAKGYNVVFGYTLHDISAATVSGMDNGKVKVSPVDITA